MRRFLSWDCAVKTLAWVILDVNTTAYSEILAATEELAAVLRAGLAPEDMDAVHAAAAKLLHASAFVNLIGADMIDLIPDKKLAESNELERARALKLYLEQCAEVTPRPDISVVIESQQCNNFKSSDVSSYLVFHYAHSNVIKISPRLKDGLEFAGEKCGTGYPMRKAHSIKNFAQLDSVFGWNRMDYIPAKQKSHIADACVQVFAYVKRQKMMDGER